MEGRTWVGASSSCVEVDFLRADASMWPVKSFVLWIGVRVLGVEPVVRLFLLGVSICVSSLDRTSTSAAACASASASLFLFAVVGVRTGVFTSPVALTPFFLRPPGVPTRSTSANVSSRNVSSFLYTVGRHGAPAPDLTFDNLRATRSFLHAISAQAWERAISSSGLRFVARWRDMERRDSVAESKRGGIVEPGRREVRDLWSGFVVVVIVEG